MDVSYCVGAESVTFDFGVSSTDTVTPFTYDIEAPDGVDCSGEGKESLLP